MKDTLADIRKKLQDGLYRNEEHVRLSLVARILKNLGWDLWNPNEVFSEFPVVPSEDLSRVDIALFATPYVPSVFVEIKAVGKLDRNIREVERQLRDYNRNNTALFSVMTDGRKWRFYHSQTGGEFSQKCFKALDILEDEIADLELSFVTFLSKSEIINGNAKHNAESYLRLNQKQRAMENSLQRARRMVMSPPYPSLPQALTQLVSEIGLSITIHEATQFIQKIASQSTAPELPPFQELLTPPAPAMDRRVRGRLPPDGTSCRFSYKGKTFQGRIENGQLVVSDLGMFDSFSAASSAATKTQRNGWLDWEIRLPATNNWQLADTWRSKVTSQSVTSELPSFQRSLTPPAPAAGRRVKGLLPPDGTSCRFFYKGRAFQGRIENGQLVVSSLGPFDSFSAASSAATNTQRNGWRDWEIRLPGTEAWQLADMWRKKR